MKLRILFLILVGCTLSAVADAKKPFELRDGDRVVFLGDTLMEREQYHGYIELMLASHFPERHVTFRNLGWSGDTPEGITRTGLSLLQAGHEPADEGWKQLQGQISMTKPTVVFIGYGMASSFDGEKGLPKFSGDMNRLMDMILQQNEKVRFVLLSPIRHENLGAPLLDPEKHNEQLALYTKAIEKLAQEKDAHFISLFDLLKIGAKKTRTPLTDNGIHLNAHGYEQAALAIERGLGWKSENKIKPAQLEAIRKEIFEKNKLFFNRSRPANMAYILGFRKYEQGKNAVEIPMFDPLIEAKERTIAKLLQGENAATASEPPPAKKEWVRTEQPVPEFEVAPGFEVKLFAEDPQLAKPIHMNFDPQGRLWVVSSEVYPQIEPGQAASDKVLILEDKDNDGVAEKSTVFVDGLLIPTGVVPGDGGVYVGQSTELLHFKDTDGDGKADQRKIVLSGFGTEDTHHIIHTLRWGMDGQLYFNQSIYIRADLETPHNVVRLRSGGIFNLRPLTMDLEVYLRGFCNAWGHVFDDFGQSFVTDGCGGQGVSLGVRDATYFTYAKMRRELKSISPGAYPKFCGLEIIKSQHFPEDWQGSLITCDFRAHRVVHFGLEEQGAGFITKELPDLMRTTNITFRPIDVKMGPDGALYIADWSNPIIQHGEVDFRDPRRDHEHGRIWRVTAKGRPLVEKPKLVAAKNSELFEQLRSPNLFNQEQARRVLTERGEKIKGDLAKWTKTQNEEKPMLEALWMYQAIDVVEPALLQKVLMSRDGRIRAAAIRVLSFWQDRIKNADALFAKSVRDDVPRVRLETVRALSKKRTARSAELVLSALNYPMDPFLDYAIWLSINDLAQPWLDAIQSGAWKIEGRERQLEFGLKSIEPVLASTVLEKSLARKNIPRDGNGPWIELIGQSGGPAQLRQLFDQLLLNDFKEPVAVRGFTALTDAARLRNVKPSGELDALNQLLTHSNSKIQEGAIRLAGAWKLSQFVPSLLLIAGEPSGSADVRLAAFESLREMGGPEVVKGLSALAEKNDNLKIRQQAVTALATVNLNKAMPYVLSAINTTTNETDSAELWRALLSVKNGGQRIATALAQTNLSVVMANAGLKIAREGGRTEPELVQALMRAGNLDSADKTLTLEEMKQLVASISGASANRGEKVFRRQELNCVTCHAIGGAGGKVGPDLTSMGASAPLDYLIESVLYPNAKIKEGFHSLLLQTKEDQEFSGIFVRETDNEIVLRDAANKEVSVPKKNLESRRNGGSLMPSGLIDNLSAGDRADLLRFLSELGKPGPFDASKGNVARTWKLFIVTSEREQFSADPLIKGDFNISGWTTIFTTVNGSLAKSDLNTQLAPVVNRGISAVYLGTKLQLSSAGKIRFKLEPSQSAQIWVDGKPVSNLETDLEQGKHTVVLKLDAKKLPEQIRLESSEGTFLAE